MSSLASTSTTAQILRPMPSVLRGILATVTNITWLTSLCLAELMRRCLALRPSHPIDRAGRKSCRLSGPQPALFRRPGYSYAPHSSGPPSWLETQRAQRAFWTVQLYLDLCRSIFDGRIQFARQENVDDGGGERLRNLEVTKLEKFGPQPYPMVAGERAMTTVVESHTCVRI